MKKIYILSIMCMLIAMIATSVSAVTVSKVTADSMFDLDNSNSEIVFGNSDSSDNARGEKISANIKIAYDGTNHSNVVVEITREGSYDLTDYAFGVSNTTASANKSGEYIELGLINTTNEDEKTFSMDMTIPKYADSGKYHIGKVEILDGIGGAALKSYDLYYEAESKLGFEDGEVEVDIEGEKSEDIEDGDNVDEDIRPNKEMEISFEVVNLFNDDDEDIEIKDVEVTLEIDGFDIDEDDIEIEKDIGDIEAEEDKKVEFKITAPYDFEEDRDFEAIITLEGEDDNDATHTTTFTFYFEGDRISKDLYLKQYSPSKTKLNCGDYFNLEVELVNIGSNDVDNAGITVDNSLLGIFHEVNNIELESIEDDDDDAVINKDFKIEIPKNAESKTYTFNVNGNLDNSMWTTKSFEIEVVCQDDEEDDSETQEEQDNGSIVVEDNTQQENEPVVIEPTITGDEEQEETEEYFTEETDNSANNTLIYLLAGLNIVLLTGIIIVAVVLSGKKKDRF